MRRLPISIALATLLVSGAAAAATATGNFTVNATVVSSCRVSNTSNINFGNYDPTAAGDVDASGSVSVRCTRGTAYNVALDQGGNPAGGSTAALPLRQMANGVNRLRYDIYSDSGRTTAWGNGAGNPAGTAASNAAIVLTTYGRLPAGQDAAIGSYTDTVNVTVTF
jgi:spore coat protein U-like protein